MPIKTGLKNKLDNKKRSEKNTRITSDSEGFFLPCFSPHMEDNDDVNVDYCYYVQGEGGREMESDAVNAP